MTNLVLTGGGTAGHVIPNIALIKDADTALGRAVREKNVAVHYIGSHEGMERELLSRTAPDWPYIPIEAGRLRRFLTIPQSLHSLQGHGWFSRCSPGLEKHWGFCRLLEGRFCFCSRRLGCLVARYSCRHS